MAIKVGGTEVVDNNRQLKNIASVDATTVAALGTAGVGGGGGLVSRTSDGAIAAKDPVILTSTGKVKKVGLSAPPVDDAEARANNDDNTAVVYDSTANKYIFIYHTSSNLYYKIGTPDGSGNVTYSSGVLLDASAGYFACAYNPADNKFVIAYTASNGNGPIYATYTLSGTTLSYTGSYNASISAIGYDIMMTYDPYSECCVAAFKAGSGASSMQYYMGAVNSAGNTPSVSSQNSTHSYIQMTGLTAVTNNDNIFVQFREGQVGQNSWIQKWQVSTGKSLSGPHSSADVGSYQIQGLGLSTDTSSTSQIVVGVYRDTAASNATKYYRWNTVSGGQQLISSTSLSGTIDPVLINEPVTGKIHLLRQDGTALKQIILDVQSTVSEGTETTLIASNVEQAPIDNYTLTQSFNNRAVFSYKSDSSGSSAQRTRRLSASEANLTATNLLGISNETKSDGQTTEIAIIGSVVSGFTGLSIGTNYYVHTDGTITSTSTNGQLIGKAISATEILVTEV